MIDEYFSTQSAFQRFVSQFGDVPMNLSEIISPMTTTGRTIVKITLMWNDYTVIVRLFQVEIGMAMRRNSVSVRIEVMIIKHMQHCFEFTVP